MFTVRRAVSEDVERITGILRNAGVNEKGVDKHVERFLVVEDPSVTPKRMVGTVGLEVYGDRGLLRSFVMDNQSWNARTGMELIELVLQFARKSGLSEIYLLAGISSNIFEYFGFRPLAWEDLPLDVRQSEHVHQSKTEGGQPMVYRRANVAES
ncbi:GNAT family N-acetyltransferase [Salinithrix halophila]|uniref:GNAT family N-acetyltransferase n=1 Tax=Salinithrix halophila TaxID=1485204 RepID=A0ABV8JHU1_9BACL